MRVHVLCLSVATVTLPTQLSCFGIVARHCLLEHCLQGSLSTTRPIGFNNQIAENLHNHTMPKVDTGPISYLPTLYSIILKKGETVGQEVDGVAVTD